MTIQIDTREKKRTIKNIKLYFDRQHIQYFDSKLFVGDYMSLDNPRLIIDRKKDLPELCGNVSGQTKVYKKNKEGEFILDEKGNKIVDHIIDHHKRFKGELTRAQDNGIKLIILCEHGGNIKRLEDVNKWYNPRLKKSPLAVSGQRLFKILSTMSKTYNVDFLFCNKSETGKRIIEILTKENESNGI